MGWTLLAVAVVSGLLVLAGQWLTQHGENNRQQRAESRAERERNESRLNHARGLMEDIAVALHAAAMQLDHTGNVIVWVLEDRIEYRIDGEPEPLTAQQAAIEEARLLQEKLAALWTLEGRLMLWLPKEHRALTALAEIRKSYIGGLSVLTEWSFGNRTGPDLTAALSRMQAAISAAEDDFRDACRPIVAPAISA